MTEPEQTHTETPGQERPRQSWLRRYLALPTLAVIGVLIYVSFFGDNSVVRRVHWQHVIDSLNVELERQADSLEYYKDLNRRLNTDPELMEQVVREQYNMKRPHEDIYIVQ